MMRAISLFCASAIATVCSPVVVADGGGAGSGGALLVHPAQVRLEALNDVQRIVVLHVDAAGITRDVTGDAIFAAAPAGIVTIVRSGESGQRASTHGAVGEESTADTAVPPSVAAAGRCITPVADGECSITVEYAGLKATVRVVVSGAGQRRAVSFRNDVEPVLMKAGCNTGTCHGNARGQDGFRLSLFGFDPQRDYVNLTRQASGRRTDLSAPASSLMLQKGIASVTHGGGRRFEADSPLYATLERWIEDGARDDPSDLPALTGIELLPRDAVLLAGGAPLQMIVRATYADGTDRDVTPLAVFSSLNDAVARIEPDGGLRPGSRGETFVMARFGIYTVVSQMIIVDDTTFEWPAAVEARNYIDEAVHAKLERLKIVPSDICNDETFLRRAYLDLLGVLPTVPEHERFVADEGPDKRARLIDELLTRPEFPELWAMKWAELLRIESGKLNLKGVQLYNDWLRDAIQRDVPLDRIVRELLTSEGGNYQNPAANFYLVDTSPTQTAENVSQVFLGIRIQCTQCHNHPFERWTMDDYYSFAAFFSQVGRKQSEDPRERIVYNSRSGEVRHKTDGRVMPPKFLGGETPQIPSGGDRRAVLAAWLTSKDNPWFAANVANRVWAHFFGRGLVDPADDVRVSNPPSHPELLAALGRRLTDSAFDIRALVRDICNSRAYQRSGVTNASNRDDLRNFSHAHPRRLPAEQLLDAISQVTGVPEKFAGLPLGARAVQVADARTGSYFLSTFGRPTRESACTCARRDEPTLSQALHLINGVTIASKIRMPEGRLHRMLAANKPVDEIVVALYVAALSRRPTEKERAAAAQYVEASQSVAEGLEDVFWALLNAQAFVFNH